MYLIESATVLANYLLFSSSGYATLCGLTSNIIQKQLSLGPSSINFLLRLPFMRKSNGLMGGFLRKMPRNLFKLSFQGLACCDSWGRKESDATELN